MLNRILQINNFSDGSIFLFGAHITGTGNLIRFRTKAWLVLTHLGFLSLNIALMLLLPAVVVDAHK